MQAWLAVGLEDGDFKQTPSPRDKLYKGSLRIRDPGQSLHTFQRVHVVASHTCAHNLGTDERVLLVLHTPTALKAPIVQVSLHAHAHHHSSSFTKSHGEGGVTTGVGTG
eukprot:GHVO01050661.1.p1 GENE.GHVO01050661.1~~GHVO01050661.1.p1  ORF type:complete len:109 (+),score=10.38 GHVO01050661.1:104-430(+)